MQSTPLTFVRSIKLFAKPSRITTRVTLTLLLLCVLSITGMVLSKNVSESIQGNAHIINRIGSMRMQSYRLLALAPLSQGEDKQRKQEEVFQLSLYLFHPSFTQFLGDKELSQDYLELKFYWDNTLQPSLISAQTSQDSLIQVEHFVAMLDHFISKIDRLTEKKITEITVIQYVFMLLMLLALVMSLVRMKKHIFTRWIDLLKMASSFRKGVFSHRIQTAEVIKPDEIDRLGLALNDMADDLEAMYTDLEARVAEKTQQLTHQHRYLDFLYRVSRQLSQNNHQCDRLVPLMLELSEITTLRNVQLEIDDFNQADNPQKIQMGLKKRPDNCSNVTCNACYDQSDDELRISHYRDYGLKTSTLKQHVWLLSDDIARYGQVSAYIPIEGVSEDEQQLVDTFVELLTHSLALSYQDSQYHHLLLIKERSTIARELHDSIAQSLSCLKIKVSCLQMLQTQQVMATDVEMEKNPNSMDQVALIKEMRTEIDVAYKQLRELLVTFRLKIDSAGLHPALKKTINEYEVKMGIEVQFNYQVPANCISPHQSIHVLQIVREALNNCYKHAHASQIKVDVALDKSEPENTIIQIVISDNGRGMVINGNRGLNSELHDGQPSPVTGHYGLTIMRDRAKSLPGECLFQSERGKGTTVKIVFQPDNM